MNRWTWLCSNKTSFIYRNRQTRCSLWVIVCPSCVRPLVSGSPLSSSMPFLLAVKHSWFSNCYSISKTWLRHPSPRSLLGLPGQLHVSHSLSGLLCHSPKQLSCHLSFPSLPPTHWELLGKMPYCLCAASALMQTLTVSLWDEFDVITWHSILFLFLFLFGWILTVNSKYSKRKCSFQIKISSIPQDTDHLDKSEDEFQVFPGSVILWWRKEEMRPLCSVVNYAWVTEKLSENDNLRGNGDPFERSEGVFFLLLSPCIAD